MESRNRRGDSLIGKDQLNPIRIDSNLLYTCIIVRNSAEFRDYKRYSSDWIKYRSRPKDLVCKNRVE